VFDSYKSYDKHREYSTNQGIEERKPGREEVGMICGTRLGFRDKSEGNIDFPKHPPACSTRGRQLLMRRT
jgi:hypothetical protein